MKAIAKLVLGGAALGVAYVMSKRDVQVGTDGIQRFSPDAQKKAVSTLSRAGLGDTPASDIPGQFALGVMPGGGSDAQFPNATKFINGVVADGMKILVTKNILDDGEVQRLQAVVLATSLQNAFEIAKSGSDFVML